MTGKLIILDYRGWTMHEDCSGMEWSVRKWIVRPIATGSATFTNVFRCVRKQRTTVTLAFWTRRKKLRRREGRRRESDPTSFWCEFCCGRPYSVIQTINRMWQRVILRKRQWIYCSDNMSDLWSARHNQHRRCRNNNARLKAARYWIPIPSLIADHWLKRVKL